MDKPIPIPCSTTSDTPLTDAVFAKYILWSLAKPEGGDKCAQLEHALKRPTTMREHAMHLERQITELRRVTRVFMETWENKDKEPGWVKRLLPAKRAVIAALNRALRKPRKDQP